MTPAERAARIVTVTAVGPDHRAIRVGPVGIERLALWDCVGDLDEEAEGFANTIRTIIATEIRSAEQAAYSRAVEDAAREIALWLSARASRMGDDAMMSVRALHSYAALLRDGTVTRHLLTPALDPAVKKGED